MDSSFVRGPGSCLPHSHQVIDVSLESQQDDAWEGNRVNQSERSVSPVTLLDGRGTTKWEAEKEPPQENNLGFLQRYGGSWVGVLVVTGGLLSPVLMLLAHKFGFQSVHTFTSVGDCGTECHALLLSLAVKLIVLLGGIWCIFWRWPNATLPRIHLFRSTTLILTFLACFTFWLFYWVRAEEHLSILGAVAFAGGLTDALLAIHYLGTLLVEIRHLQPEFQISILRSPDGQERSFLIGTLSIQRTAVWALQKYYTHFPAFNPHRERLPPIKKPNISEEDGGSSFKFYNFEGQATFPHIGRVSSRSRATTHNERFYEEIDFERRLKKRKARLVEAAEEAFTQVKRIQEENGGGQSLNSGETAAAVFPSLARPLQKYLRCCREQPWHSAESVLNHLATCLRLGLSSKAFLQKFLSPPPVIPGEGTDHASWALVSEASVSSGISHGTQFLLRGGDVSLFIRLTALPHFNIQEEVIDPKSNKFTLRLSSETSV